MKRLCKKKQCIICVDYDLLEPDTYRGIYALEDKKKIAFENTGNFNKDIWTVYNKIKKWAILLYTTKV